MTSLTISGHVIVHATPFIARLFIVIVLRCAPSTKHIYTHIGGAGDVTGWWRHQDFMIRISVTDIRVAERDAAYVTSQWPHMTSQWRVDGHGVSTFSLWRHHRTVRNRSLHRCASDIGQYIIIRKGNIWLSIITGESTLISGWVWLRTNDVNKLKSWKLEWWNRALLKKACSSKWRVHGHSMCDIISTQDNEFHHSPFHKYRSEMKPNIPSRFKALCQLYKVLISVARIASRCDVHFVGKSLGSSPQFVLSLVHVMKTKTSSSRFNRRNSSRAW